MGVKAETSSAVISSDPDPNPKGFQRLSDSSSYAAIAKAWEDKEVELLCEHDAFRRWLPSLLFRGLSRRLPCVVIPTQAFFALRPLRWTLQAAVQERS